MWKDVGRKMKRNKELTFFAELLKTVREMQKDLARIADGLEKNAPLEQRQPDEEKKILITGSPCSPEDRERLVEMINNALADQILGKK